MNPSPLSDEERADLVAYLDGELTGEAAQEMAARISLDPRVRAEAEALKRTWDLLDFLPRPEVAPSFTERTLSRIQPLSPSAAPSPHHTAPLPAGWRVALAGSWVAALLLAGWLGYRGYHALAPGRSVEADLIRDLRVIENLRFYEQVEDLEFLKQLDDPDLFGEDTGS